MQSGVEHAEAAASSKQQADEESSECEGCDGAARYTMLPNKELERDEAGDQHRLGEATSAGLVMHVGNVQRQTKRDTPKATERETEAEREREREREIDRDTSYSRFPCGNRANPTRLVSRSNTV